MLNSLWEKKNINDIVRNIREWTTEVPHYRNDTAVFRGEDAIRYWYMAHVCSRYGLYLSMEYATDYVGFRLVLCVKLKKVTFVMLLNVWEEPEERRIFYEEKGKKIIQFLKI